MSRAEKKTGFAGAIRVLRVSPFLPSFARFLPSPKTDGPPCDTLFITVTTQGRG